MGSANLLEHLRNLYKTWHLRYKTSNDRSLFVAANRRIEALIEAQS